MHSNKINYIKTTHKAETEMQREFFRKKKVQQKSLVNFHQLSQQSREGPE